MAHIYKSLSRNNYTSVAKAARELDVSIMTIYRWVRSGKIEGVKIADWLCIPKSEIRRMAQRELPLKQEPSSAEDLIQAR